MNRTSSGRYKTTSARRETARALAPPPLPPEPPLDLLGSLQRLLEPTTLPLGRLDSASPLLPDLQLRQHSAITSPTANKTMALLVEAGIARELTGNRHNRVFSYDAYLTILNEGGEPL